MNNFEKYNKYDFDLVGSSRFVFDTKTSGKAKAPAVKEVAPPSPEQLLEKAVADAKARYKVQKKGLREKIADVKQSHGSIPAIAQAAKEADLELKKLDKNIDEEGQLSKRQIEKKLETLQKILTFFDTYPGVESTKREVVNLRIEQEGKIEDYYEEFKTYVDENEDLSTAAKNQLHAMGAESEDEIIDMLDAAANVDTSLTLSAYLEDASLLDRISAYADRSKGMLEGSVHDLFNQMKEEKTRFLSEAEAVITVDLAKDAERAVDYVRSLCKSAMSDYENDKELTGKVEAIEENALQLLLLLLNKPEDAKKRILVIADLRAKLMDIRLNKTGDDDVDSEIFMTMVTKQSGYKYDKYGKAFAGGVVVDGGEKFAVGEVFNVKGRPNFRMEGMGIQVTTLDPSTEVRLYDRNVYKVLTATGETVRYAKVQLNPPDGAIGYISVNNVDFGKGGILDDRLPTLPGQEAPAGESAPEGALASTSASPDKGKIINIPPVKMSSFVPAELAGVTDAKIATVTTADINKVKQRNAGNLASLQAGGPGTSLPIFFGNSSVTIYKNAYNQFYFEGNPSKTFDLEPAVIAAIIMLRGREKGPESTKKGSDNTV